MKNTLVAAALLAALSVPALAQPGPSYGGYHGPPPPGGYGGPPPPNAYGAPPPPGSIWYGAPSRIRDRVGFLENRMQRLRQAGRLAPQNYYQLHVDLMNVQRQDERDRYNDGGELNPQDRQYLWQRLQIIASKLNWSSRYAY